MAEKKRKNNNKNNSKNNKSQFQKALFTIVAVVVIIIAVAEKLGYDPIGAVRDKISGSVSGNVSDDLTVNFIDVGQGDCIYISAGDSNMLIDCGEASESETVKAYLDNLGVTSLDYVVATHPHSDHMGGMSEIVLNYDIGEIIMPYLPDEDVPTTRFFEKFLDACDSKGLSATDAEAERIIKLGDAEAEIIAPLSQKYNGLNNYSVGLLLTHGNNTFLFTGDAEEEAETEMLESGKLKHVKVYKAGHHGSSTSSSEDFLEAISPEYAVIMCGIDNSYGHPHEETLEGLSKYVKQIYRTDLNGNIIIESDGATLHIQTERQS